MCASCSPATTAGDAWPIGWRWIIPDGSSKLAVLDIVPTWAMWHRMDARLAMRAWHWPFLALPAPFPETMIGKDPIFFFDWRAGARNQDQGSLRLRSARARPLPRFLCRSLCAFMRFARTTVRGALPTSRMMRRTARPERRSPVPCSPSGAADGGVPAETDDPVATWREWATDVRGFGIDSGHYLAEEAPGPTARR